MPKGIPKNPPNKGWFKKGRKLPLEINRRRLKNLRKKLTIQPNKPYPYKTEYRIRLYKQNEIKKFISSINPTIRGDFHR